METKGDFLTWRGRAEAPEARAVNLPAEPRVVKAASLRAEARPDSLVADFKGPRPASSRAEARPGSLGADWVRQAQLPGE